MAWWDTLVDDSLEGGAKGALRWAWKKIGPYQEGEPKLVDNDYIRVTGLEAAAGAEGMTLRWVKADRIATRVAEGWDFAFEPDNVDRIKRKLVRYDGTVLMQRPNRQ